MKDKREKGKGWRRGRERGDRGGRKRYLIAHKLSNCRGWVGYRKVISI